jgi:signal transduction histidine kinase
MVLHNIFFLTLGTLLYLAVLPPLENLLRSDWRREGLVVRELFAEGRFSNPAEPARIPYRYAEGTATSLDLPADVKSALDQAQARIVESPSLPGVLFQRLADERYARLELPARHARELLWRQRIIVFAVLAAVYLLAIVLLESVIMPTYVYRPLTLVLEADRASIQGDREREIIRDPTLPDDEIGQIIHSRNQMVAELRRQEDRLSEALARLEDTAADLQRKNQLLETAKLNLEHQDRLVSLGLMSASVAHELNTPLAVLHGSLEMLRESAPSERIERMLRVTQRLRRISESLLDFARVRRSPFQPVPLYPILEESWQLVSIDDKAHYASFVNLIPPSQSVSGNPDRLIQVFVNLLRNALQAIPPGGQITARTETQGTMISILIEDNGPGIPPEVLNRVFEAFVTARLDDRGTGLGLTVAEGIVQQHGGTIEARNREGGGASIRVSLPEAEKVAA